MIDICMVQGSGGPERLFTLEDGAGQGVNIGNGSVALRISCLDHAYQATRPMAIVDGGAGKVRYYPILADTAEPGLYRLEIAVTFDDGTLEVFPCDGPIWMEVRARV
jgi:hypothetical protein